MISNRYHIYRSAARACRHPQGGLHECLYAPGAVLFERLHLRSRLAWLRAAYIGLIAVVGALLAPDVMPVLPPSAAAHDYAPLQQVLADRLGWDSVTNTVERVYGALPDRERAQACVLASNYGEAGSLQQLAPPGRLPSVISGHNNYYFRGPGRCSGTVLILVGYAPNDVLGAPTLFAHIRRAAIDRCRDCVAYERTLPIYVLSGARRSIFPQLWPSLKHYD